MEDKEMYSIKETAERLSLGYQTVLNLAKRGYILAARHGGQWRITKDEINRFKRYGNFEEEIDIIDIEEDTPVDIS